jgi:REP element-mobilizing transposase RayT
MARAVRMNYPDTFYHVLSRGIERRSIFREPADYEKFTNTIGGMVERFGVEIHAYVLMANHYHLLIRTRYANLSKAIQWLGLSYSMWFNRRYERTGHLFQGRFKSFVIEDDHYFTAMCLYIHRNPIRAGIVENLLEYPWSSYPAYVNARKREPWLTTGLVLGMYGGDRKRFVDAQLAYSDQEKSYLDSVRYGLFLGSEKFVAKWKKRLERERHREKPQARIALKGEGVSGIVERVFKGLGVSDPKPLLKPIRREKRPKRDLAIYITCCLGLFSHQEIGQVFGVGYTTITGALNRAREYVNSDKNVRKDVERILNDI